MPLAMACNPEVGFNARHATLESNNILQPTSMTEIKVKL